ncbi:MAG: F0F1 ATP synthase subunit A [Planctomycetaceae bacterium]|jgi:F-type H+-transporting ATPase subunit a|nr:F0F1 ATP synthase subunit A [Planctomycetaceae bacterium]
MANPILHIKDAYFFEVPKFLLPSNKTKPSDFPRVWLKLDPDVQRIEALEMAHAYPVPKLSAEQSVQKWESWSHQDGNHGAPYDVFFSAKEYGSIPQDAHMQAEESAIARADEFTQQWKYDGRLEWYNHHISGKILIPQPFAELRNFHEAESGFAISKFMVIELAVAIIIFVLFSRLAKKIKTGEPVRGRFNNFLETFLIFVRDEISRPSIGSDADFHHGHDDDDHHDSDAPLTYKKADALTPIFWTMFLFITGCNLFGLVPWAGSPTAVFGVTFALAVTVLLASLIAGSIMHGPIGFWLAQLPSMDLSFSISLVIKPMLWSIEIVGLFIKHGVLAIRLLANMVAGHIVLLSIMGMATLAAGNLFFLIAPITIIGAVCIGLLELFVAFLQAYVFTLLSALFIGAAMHHH